MNIIPRINGNVKFDKASSFSCNDLTINCSDFEANCIEVFISRMNSDCKIKSDNANIVISKNKNYDKEEYSLAISTDKISIEASTEHGVILALSTLYQLINNDEIICCEIHEKPRFSHRGLSLDTVRNFFSLNEVKKIINQMSLVKMNVLHWHLSDDQGWRIESKLYPKLHSGDGDNFYSHEEIRDIVVYAQKRGVEIIPEIDMPGHMSALLSAYPEYSCSKKPVEIASCGGIYPIILCAGEEKTYELMGNLLDEICPLFSSSRFHIGGDEAPKKEWKSCPICQKKMKDESLKNEAELQGYFSNRIIAMLKERGKSPYCWNESLEAANLEKDVLVQYWTVNCAESMLEYVKNGGKFVYSDMFTYYFDYPYSMSPLKRVYEEPMVIGDYDCTNSSGMQGIEVCLWTEHLKENQDLEKRIFPRIYAIAEIMWSSEHDYGDFEKRLDIFLMNFHPNYLAYEPENHWNPTGTERQNEAFSYMKSITSSMSNEAREETIESAAPNQMFNQRFMQCFFEPEDLALFKK